MLGSVVQVHSLLPYKTKAYLRVGLCAFWARKPTVTQCRRTENGARSFRTSAALHSPPRARASIALHAPFQVPQPLRAMATDGEHSAGHSTFAHSRSPRVPSRSKCSDRPHRPVKRSSPAHPACEFLRSRLTPPWNSDRRMGAEKGDDHSSPMQKKADANGLPSARKTGAVIAEQRWRLTLDTPI